MCCNWYALDQRAPDTASVLVIINLGDSRRPATQEGMLWGGSQASPQLLTYVKAQQSLLSSLLPQDARGNPQAHLHLLWASFWFEQRCNLIAPL